MRLEASTNPQAEGRAVEKDLSQHEFICDKETMAIRYGDGKAGQFAKTKAQQHFDRLIIINVALAGLFCAVTGLLLGGILLGPALQSSGFYRRFSRNEVIWWSVAFQLLLLAAASVFISTASKTH